MADKPKTPEDIIQAVYDSALQAVRTSVQLILEGEVSVDAVKIMDAASPARLKVKPDGTGENGAVVILNQQPLPEGAATEAKQDALAAKDFATEVTLAAILAKLITAPATETKQDALLSKDFSTESTLAAILAKLIESPATEAKQDGVISLLAGGAREHREQAAVSTSYVASSNSISFSTARKHLRIYCEEDMYWVDSAIDDTDAATKLVTADQRGFVKAGDKLELSIASGITRLDFLAVNTAGAVYVTGLV